MTVIDTDNLSKRYKRKMALDGCSLQVPAGRIVGLVGPNGAGKSTLLGMVCGALTPTSGAIRVLGGTPGTNARQLARVGFVAQDAPVYGGLSVADHLRLGARLNPRWDAAFAQRRVQRLGLDPRQKAGSLSGGQRAQLALTLAAAKRGDLLVLDEPVAALDPIARRAFLRDLLDFVAELGVSVVLSSHLLGDLEHVCDYLIVLAMGRVQLAGEVDQLLAVHHRVNGGHPVPSDAEVVYTEHNTAIVRAERPVPGAEKVDLEDLGLAYMTREGY